MKTYMPNELFNNNFHYTINNDYYVVHTNRNCFTQYNTTYCDCYNVYPKLDYNISQSYQCAYNVSTSISYSNFTNNIWYRIDLVNILIIFTILFIFIIKYPYRIISRFFGRWLKV